MCFSLKSIVTHANSQTAASSALTVEDPAHVIRGFELYVPTRGGVAKRHAAQNSWNESMAPMASEPVVASSHSPTRHPSNRVQSPHSVQGGAKLI